MKHRIMRARLKRNAWALTVMSATFFFFIIQGQSFGQSGKWEAPAVADTYKNPYTGDATAVTTGKKIYKKLCEICHGTKGKGDGLAGMALKPRPADFSNPEIQNQSDGAIYWKLSEGRAPMAPYKDSLTEEERWQLVSFIRSL